MKKFLVVLLTVVLAAGMISCGGAGGGEEQKDLKIISLSPNVTEILYAIGAGKYVVARSTWCTYPEEALALEAVGDAYGVDTEKILALDPKYIFVAGTFGTDATTLTEAGIEIISVNGKTAEDLYDQITYLGSLTGCEAGAKDLNDSLKAQLETLKGLIPAGEPKKIFLDWGYLYSSSKEDFLGNTIEELGVENIAFDYEASSPCLSAEAVIAANPEYYLAGSSEADFFKPEGFDDIAAFKNGNVLYFDYTDKRMDMITRMGPRFVDGLVEIAKLIYPEVDFTSAFSK